MVQYFINSYKKNHPEATKVQENLIELGIDKKDITIVNGYDIKENGMLMSKVCFHNFFDKILPNVKEDMYYLEDNTIIYENPEYFPKYKMVHWLGFINILKDYIVGAHLVYLSKEMIEEIRHGTYTPTHIDRFFRKLGKEYGMEIKKSITKVRPHYSQTIGKIRNWDNKKHFFL